jgi:sec-independent protein translocase protein TatA
MTTERPKKDALLARLRVQRLSPYAGKGAPPMFGLGPTEMILIAVIILLFFGAKRLPEIGQGLGKAISNFRNIKSEINKEDDEPEKKEAKRESSGSIEDKVKSKIIDSVPGVKQVRNIKDKADKIKSIMN